MAKTKPYLTKKFWDDAFLGGCAQAFIPGVALLTISMIIIIGMKTGWIKAIAVSLILLGCMGAYYKKKEMRE